MGSFIGSIIFELWGAGLVYIIQFGYRKLTGKKPKTFNQVYNGKKKDEQADIFLSGSIHIAIGIGSCIFILLLLNEITR